MATQRRASNTREAILEILRHHDARSVGELAAELGLAGAAVRRHLDVLLRDGYISVAQVRGRTGRPRYAFSLTEAGADFFGHHYVRITRRLLHEIAALTADDTAGHDGSQLAELVFRKLALRLAGEYAPRVEGVTLAERTHAAARLLEDEGFDFDVLEEGGELRLLGRGCPCHRLGQAAHGPLADALAGAQPAA
ncbi:MAG: helix-turn-helix domain-containing protein, partial [Chloroflexi bacterium]|nr:helix-turn-helix domain-containing protein [Chloroflexota bacterium]